MTERKYLFDIKKKMTEVGTFHESHRYVMRLLARAMSEYDQVQEEFESSGGELTIEQTNVKGATNLVKNPAYQAIEKLRTDILLYCRELGLTPAGLKRINEQGMKQAKTSKFEDFLSGKTPARKGS